eukprot:TRINITY_DN55933_c0_g1_i1.p1 TRINITY_DN55933_c0_g1~~TRINITY_DN55933_c0_g1_i1.p1  ORF type:complete len:296 (-),score=41.54 TRINITY_DN55933_c0_g1_i1:142-993(-)
MRFFPGSTIGLNMGLCTFGFALSGLVWTALFSHCESFDILDIFSVVCAMIFVVSLPQFCLGSGSRAEKVATKPSCAQYKQSMCSIPFFILWSMGFALRAPAWVIIGLLKPWGIASAANGSALVTVCLAVNVVIRFPVGWGYDYLKSRWPSLSLQNVLSRIVLLFVIGACLLVADALGAGNCFVWPGCLLCIGAFSACAPLCNVWVREYFDAEVRGGIYGAHAITISFGNFLVTAWFGPQHTDRSSDFLGLSAALAGLGAFLLLVLLCFTAKSQQERLEAVLLS